MNFIVALIIGVLFASSIYLMLNRNFFKVILGVIVFGYASIYFLFIISGVTQNNPPLIREETAENLEKMADPLPQALTLTAIVIGIGVQLFVIVLLNRVYKVLKMEDLDELHTTDEIDQPKNQEK